MKGDHQEDRPPNACGPILKRLARNDDGQTLADTHGLDEVEKGECGRQLKKWLHDVITDLGHLSEADVKEQITIRMTKTMHQDPPPLLYPGQQTDKTHNSRTLWLCQQCDDFRYE
jgi:hypothetical protein